jgi:molybdopterin adenylyltransferase
MTTPDPVTAAIVTVSDRSARGERDDVTGPALARAVADDGVTVAHSRIESDDPERLAGAIAELAAAHDVVLLAGGTGVSPRDRTPEAVARACHLMIPGVGEAIRAASRDRVPTSSLSRACGGLCGHALVVALPGSPGGAVDGWAAIAPFAPHAVAQARGGDHRE